MNQTWERKGLIQIKMEVQENLASHGRAESECVKVGKNADPCTQVYTSSSCSVVASKVSFPRKEA